MALPSTVYKANIQLSDVDRGVYETLKATVARHPSETEERLAAKLLAYAIFFEPGLAFTKGICVDGEPDLWLKGPDGRVLLWVEVGLPEPDRLIKACRHSERVTHIACGRSLPNWEQQNLSKLKGITNLTVIRFDQLFINQLVTNLDRSITWSATITDGTLYLTVGEKTLESALHVRVGKR
jgi:uncharacterized protein YaeQ